MNSGDDFVLDLFRQERPVPTSNDFDNPEFTVCDFLNESPEIGMAFNYHFLEKMPDPKERLSFLTKCKRCYDVVLFELQRYNVDPTYPVQCCGSYSKPTQPKRLR